MRFIIGLIVIIICLSKAYCATSTANSTIVVTINPVTSINLKKSNLHMTAISARGVRVGEVVSSFDTFSTYGSSIVISALASNLIGSDGTSWGEGDTLMIEALGFSEEILIKNGESLSLVPIAIIPTTSNQTNPYKIKYFNNNPSRSTGNLSCTITITASSQ